MNNVTLVVAMILFSSFVTSKVTARELESSTNQDLFLSHSLPMPHWPFRGPRIALPLIPADHFRSTPFHLPQEVTRCLSDKKEVRTCFDDIAKTFFTRKANIGSECCDVIKKMNADCEKTFFGSFRSPILTGYVKLHCSTVVGSTSPVPLQAPSQPPSQAPLHAPPHAPSPAPSLASSPASSPPAPSQAHSLAPSPAHLQAPLQAPLHAPSPAPSLAPSLAPLHAPSPAPSLAPSRAHGF